MREGKLDRAAVLREFLLRQNSAADPSRSVYAILADGKSSRLPESAMLNTHYDIWRRHPPLEPALAAKNIELMMQSATRSSFESRAAVVYGYLTLRYWIPEEPAKITDRMRISEDQQEEMKGLFLAIVQGAPHMVAVRNALYLLIGTDGEIEPAMLEVVARHAYFADLAYDLLPRTSTTGVARDELLFCIARNLSDWRLNAAIDALPQTEEVSQWVITQTFSKVTQWGYPIEDNIGSVLAVINKGRLHKTLSAGRIDDGLLFQLLDIYEQIAELVLFAPDDEEYEEARLSFPLFVAQLAERDLNMEQLYSLASMHNDLFGLQYLISGAVKEADPYPLIWDVEQDRRASISLQEVFLHPHNARLIQVALADIDSPHHDDAIDIATWINGADEFELRFAAAKSQPGKWLEYSWYAHESKENKRRFLAWGAETLRIDERAAAAFGQFPQQFTEAEVAIFRAMLSTGHELKSETLPFVKIAIESDDSGLNRDAARALDVWPLADWPKNAHRHLLAALERETWETPRKELSAVIARWENAND